MLERTLEPEIMDDAEEAAVYDEMDHSAVNSQFVDDLLTLKSDVQDVLDLGTGTALIPIDLCQKVESVRVMACDFSKEMLELATYRIDVAGFRDRIQLSYTDASKLGFDDSYFDCVFSNSLVHHLPDPLPAVQHAWRVLEPDGLLFIRDLLRPSTEAEVESIVQQHAGEQSEIAQQLLRQSLHAALTIAELRAICEQVGIPMDSVSQTSDRHWTLSVSKG